MEATIQTIMEAALQQGIWAALYIYLFFRMLKENAAREEKYQAMIDSLSTNIAEGIEDIQNRLDALTVNGKLYLSHLGKKGNEYLSHPTKPL